MSQDNLDKKISKLFHSMDEKDMSEALSRKEGIWQSIDLDNDKKKEHRWLLLLLLAPLLFAAGWFLNKPSSTVSESPKVEQEERSIPMNSKQEEIEKLRTLLNDNNRALDSLIDANRQLNSDLKMIREEREAVNYMASSQDKIYLTDTVYLKEIKVEQRIVEKIVRDTVVITVPLAEEIQPVVAEIVNDKQEDKIPTGKANSKSHSPESIQFNFSEASRIDK